MAHILRIGCASGVNGERERERAGTQEKKMVGWGLVARYKRYYFARFFYVC